MSNFIKEVLCLYLQTMGAITLMLFIVVVSVMVGMLPFLIFPNWVGIILTSFFTVPIVITILHVMGDKE